MPKGAKRKAKVTVRGYTSWDGSNQNLWLPTTTTTNARGKKTTTRGFDRNAARRIVGDSGIRSLATDLRAQTRRRSDLPVSSTVHSSGAVQAKGRRPARRRK